MDERILPEQWHLSVEVVYVVQSHAALEGMWMEQMQAADNDQLKIEKRCI